MSDSLDHVKSLIEDNNINISDLEFIIKYMLKENISPQLAMRKIKTIELMDEKLKDTHDKDEIKKLKSILEEKSLALQDIKSEKDDLETQSDLLDSERETLREELGMLKEMYLSEIEDDKGEKDLPSDLVTPMTTLIDDLKSLNELNEIIKPIISPIIVILESLLQSPESYEFNINKISIDFEDKLNHVIEVKAEEKIKEAKEQTINDKPPVKIEKIVKEKPVENIKKVETKSLPEKKSFVKKDVQEDKPSAKIKSKEKEKTKEEKSHEQLTKEILNQFVDFIGEASNDAGFQERIKIICDTDEAYQYLGSIGLSQIYSYGSKGINKKDELLKLLETWKKSGVPW